MKPKENFRYLYKEEATKFAAKVYECLVLEISPSGEYVKIRSLDNYTEWARMDMLVFIEELREKEVEIPFSNYQDTKILLSK